MLASQGRGKASAGQRMFAGEGFAATLCQTPFHDALDEPAVGSGGHPWPHDGADDDKLASAGHFLPCAFASPEKSSGVWPKVLFSYKSNSISSADVVGGQWVCGKSPTGHPAIEFSEKQGKVEAVLTDMTEWKELWHGTFDLKGSTLLKGDMKDLADADQNIQSVYIVVYCWNDGDGVVCESSTQ